jgi:hypothetical protein
MTSLCCNLGGYLPLAANDVYTDNGIGYIQFVVNDGMVVISLLFSSTSFCPTHKRISGQICFFANKPVILYPKIFTPDKYSCINFIPLSWFFRAFALFFPCKTIGNQKKHISLPTF